MFLGTKFINPLIPNPEHNFIFSNPSLFEARNQLHLCYRADFTGKHNQNSQLFITALDKDYHATGPQINIWDGQDPRTWNTTDRLFLNYYFHKHQYLIELDWKDFDIRCLQEITVPNQQENEKNWLYFTDAEHRKTWMCYNLGNQEYYECPRNKVPPGQYEEDYGSFCGKVFDQQIYPDNLLLNKETYIKNNPVKWDYGEIRGGASPVHFNDELWWFFHSSKFHHVPEVFNYKIYTCGFLVTDPQPPFKARYISKEPVLTPKDYTNLGPCSAASTFVCGAVRWKNSWVLSYGVNDSSVEIAVFNDKEINHLKVPV